MFDFLNSKLSPKVRCDKPPMDGYEPENLISPDELTKSRGFLAYTSIKPPVDVDFELICAISVGYVFVSTTVGTQRSNGIEILTKTRSGEFVSVAKAFFDEEGAFFCNSRLFSRTAPPTNYCSRFHLCFLKSNTFRAFINANEVRVRILRTERSVPCLGKVEIWGRVSKLCSEVTVATIQKLMRPPLKVTKTVENNCTAKEIENAFEIPDEFKDALTYEVMTTPLTLPSGSTIDQTTLEKYIEREASYGRQPSDPFTGLKFTASRKPTLNVALKSRIDMFLIKHSSDVETYNISRTVGRTTEKRELHNRIRHLNLKRKYEEVCENISIKLKKAECKDHTTIADEDGSLDALIAKAVASKDFVKFTADEDHSTDTLHCNKCDLIENLYILPCYHLYCRKCLEQLCDGLKCTSCTATFKKAEIKKYYPM